MPIKFASSTAPASSPTVMAAAATGDLTSPLAARQALHQSETYSSVTAWPSFSIVLSA